MKNKTIVDLGACKGDDSYFYLLKGFDVIAVEANQDLCNEMQIKYKDYIDKKRLKILNVAIHEENDLVLDFYINSFVEWSSLKAKSKATSKNSFIAKQVNTMSLDRIIQQVKGQLYYIKIDIEGAELSAISSLNKSDNLPKYLSFEVNFAKTEIIDKLVNLGYTEFKIVRQGAEYLKNIKNQKEGNNIDFKFRNCHSGPFGLDLGEVGWYDKNYIIEYFDNLYDTGWSGWYDIHAKIRS